jgi:uncharacterized protein (TIGR02246 family)
MHARDPRDVDRGAILAQLESFASLTGGVEDNERYLRAFADDATILPPDRPALKGRPAILAFYNAALQEVASVRVAYEDVVIDVDHALAVRRYTATAFIIQAGSGSQRVARTKYLDVLKKSDERGWRIVVHMWSGNEG